MKKLIKITLLTLLSVSICGIVEARPHHDRGHHRPPPPARHHRPHHHHHHYHSNWGVGPAIIGGAIVAGSVINASSQPRVIIQETPTYYYSNKRVVVMPDGTRIIYYDE